jgi:hypothetical protein
MDCLWQAATHAGPTQEDPTPGGLGAWLPQLDRAVGAQRGHEDSQAAKNRALTDAVCHRRLDFVELLVAYGAELGSVPLVDALLT